MNEVKTIIGFDSWTRGAHHFARLVPALEERGYRLILLHIGSWGHDADHLAEEEIDGLLVRDISFYQGMSFSEILRAEAPNGVLFLQTRAFAHQAFNRICAHEDIPTFHLYHGLVSVQASNADRTTVHKVNRSNQFKRTVGRAQKNVFKLWPVYCKSMVQTRAPLTDWLWFLKEIYNKIAKGGYSGCAPPDTATTAGAVYTQADVMHMVEVYGVPFERICAVGNPDLMRFDLAESDIGHGLDSSRKQSGNVIYIETALARNGLVFRDAKDYSSHLGSTRDSLTRFGYQLQVKLHPASARTDLPEELKKNGIIVCSDEDFVDTLKCCTATIVETSSAALIPALLAIPVFLAKHGRLECQEYGPVLKSYTRAKYLMDINDFPALLAELAEPIDSNHFANWLEENAGPLPTEEMPKRVAKAIDEMIRQGFQRSGSVVR